MLFYGVDCYHLFTLRIINLLKAFVNMFSENILTFFEADLHGYVCGQYTPLTVLNR